MSEQRVNSTEVSRHLGRYLEDALKGISTIIVRHERAIAVLAPLPAVTPKESEDDKMAE